MIAELHDAIRYYLYSSYYSAKRWFNPPFQGWFFVIQNLLAMSFTILTVTVIYNVSSGIAGWSYLQMLFLSMVSQLTMSIATSVVIPQTIPELLRQGKFDTYLIRPYGKLTLLASDPGIVTSQFFSYFIGGIAVLAYLSIKLKLHLMALVSMLPIYVLGLAAFTMFIAMLAIALYVFFKSGQSALQINRVMIQLSKYPLNVYGTTAQLVFTLLVPIGIATYYPSQAFFGRISPAHYAFLAVFSALFTILMYKLFNHLLLSYESGLG